MASRPPQAPIIRDQDDMFQQSARSVIKTISSNPLVNGVLLKGVVLGVGTTKVPHTLGRPFVGWKVVDQNAPGTVHRDPGVTTQFQLYLPLVASGPMTVNIWVF